VIGPDGKDCSKRAPRNRPGSATVARTGVGDGRVLAVVHRAHHHVLACLHGRRIDRIRHPAVAHDLDLRELDEGRVGTGDRANGADRPATP
jgi:hypothetical protein